MDIKNVLREIRKNSSGISDLIMALPIVKVGAIYQSDKDYLEKCEVCKSNCCFFETPHYIGKGNALGFFEKTTEIPEELKKGKSNKEINQFKKIFLKQIGMDIFDRIYITLNSNWARVYENSENELIFTAACSLLSKDFRCIDYFRRFNFCKEYPENNNRRCREEFKIIYEFKKV